VRLGLFTFPLRGSLLAMGVFGPESLTALHMDGLPGGDAPPGRLLAVPSAIASGLVMEIIPLAACSVQAKAIRRRADAAELVGARAELRAMWARKSELC